ncbi:hypothetical protein DNL40_15800 [Xylanimonas oleitrophica]|uniref:Uncharacterized protein n=1 Tax=Xylanimonas oleitrophica TaxID=2607479 RepID=A0A2W5WTI7_9MICO|nr:hypothetical protein [Xylanimonas oleitrophica]PZR51556.1 hypothetical protein DNL40_15800 [Xylanimonas oleitrophica]
MSDPQRPDDAVPAGQQQPPAVPPQQAAGAQPAAYPAPPQATGPAPGLGHPATAGTEDPRLGLEVGRYWAGAVATALVAALIGLAAGFVLGDVAGQELVSPPFGGSDLVAWGVTGGLAALVAALLLHLLVASTPRPASFFGWVVALATIILAALPFAGGTDVLPAVLTAIVWIILGLAVWSLLTGVLARTLVRRPGA